MAGLQAHFGFIQQAVLQVNKWKCVVSLIMACFLQHFCSKISFSSHRLNALVYLEHPKIFFEYSEMDLG